MRLVSPERTGPARVSKYLLPHEDQVITVRQHPARLFAPAAAAMGGLLAAVIVTSALHSSWPVHLAVWALTVFLFVEWLVAVLRWTWLARVVNRRVPLDHWQDALSRRRTTFSRSSIWPTFEGAPGGRARRAAEAPVVARRPSRAVPSETLASAPV